MHLDPLFSLLIGALGAALIGLFGAWIQSRREHERWLREKRYAAHLAFLKENDRHTTLSKLGRGPKNNAEIELAIEGLNSAISELSLVGPESLLTAARKFRDYAAAFIAQGKPPTGYDDVRAEYIAVSRRSIHVSNRG